MSPPSDEVLVVIGVATASLFAAHSFYKIALIARNALRLEDYRAMVLNTAKLAQSDVKCWDVDVTYSATLCYLTWREWDKSLVSFLTLLELALASFLTLGKRN
jgi:hypothetical protein